MLPSYTEKGRAFYETLFQGKTMILYIRLRNSKKYVPKNLRTVRDLNTTIPRICKNDPVLIPSTTILPYTLRRGRAVSMRPYSTLKKMIT